MNQNGVAALIGETRHTVLRWCRAGTDDFPKPVKIVGKKYLFDRRAIFKWFRLNRE